MVTNHVLPTDTPVLLGILRFYGICHNNRRVLNDGSSELHH